MSKRHVVRQRDTEGRQGDRPHDLQRACRRAGPDAHGIADGLAQLLQRELTDLDLIGVESRVSGDRECSRPGQALPVHRGWLDVATVRGHSEHRDLLAVDSELREPEGRPASDSRCVGHELVEGSLSVSQRGGVDVLREEASVASFVLKEDIPVPPVALRVGHQPVQAGREHDSGHDGADGDDGPDQVGAHGGPSRSWRRRQGIARAELRRHGEAELGAVRVRNDVRRKRTRPSIPTARQESQASTPRSNRARTSPPPSSTVASNWKPRAGSICRTGPTGARGESSTAPTMASSKPATTASAPPHRMLRRSPTV